MASTVALAPGAIFASRYEFKERLGEGDRKHTYLAWDTKMHRLVAVSLVKPEAVFSDPEGTRREVEVLGRIGSHDNVVSLYEMELHDSTEYMVFEYLPGGTLGSYLRELAKRDESVPPDQILRLARQICRGLAHLHQNGVLHRDVTLENIWLDERKVAHLGDFDSAIPSRWRGLGCAPRHFGGGSRRRPTWLLMRDGGPKKACEVAPRPTRAMTMPVPKPPRRSRRYPRASPRRNREDLTPCNGPDPFRPHSRPPSPGTGEELIREDYCYVCDRVPLIRAASPSNRSSVSAESPGRSVVWSRSKVAAGWK